MYALPGDVFVSGQVSPSQLEALSEQGVQGVINNRPNGEAPSQPTSEDLEKAATALSLGYVHIPMSGSITPDLIEASVKAYENAPRPIIAFCAGGMRSTALWAFAHVKTLGLDAVVKALDDSPYTLTQIYPMLAQYAEPSGHD